MHYPSYVCISHAAEDTREATWLEKELSDHGFRCQRLDETVPAEERKVEVEGGAILLALISPAAARGTTCLEDLRRAMAVGRPVLCLRLAQSDLEARLFAEEGLATDEMLDLSEVETDSPEGQMWLCHHLFVRRLCRYPACFSEVRCVDTPKGECIRRAVNAHSGNSRSQYLIALTYARGGALPVMPVEARQWMERAAAGGDADALIDLGYFKLRGVGGMCDPADARALFLRAAQLGHPRGYAAYGMCCLHGQGAERDVEEAVRAFETALRDGYAPAGYRLGLMYRDGDGIPVDGAKARAYLYAACDEGGRYPLYGYRLQSIGYKARKRVFRGVSMRQMRPRLGHLLYGEDGRWQEDPRLVTRVKKCMAINRFRVDRYPEDAWLEDMRIPTKDDVARAATDRRHGVWNVANAEEALGALLEKGQPSHGICASPHAALIHYRRAVKGGSSDAMCRLGEAYFNGRGCPRDAEQAVRLFRLSAAWGNEKGRFALGGCYERGIGVPRDLAMAVECYGQAAAAGYPPAQNNLGGCYQRGSGVEQDLAAAVEWYQRAADADQPQAICRLGQCYERGWGVEPQHGYAVELYRRAARLGQPYALYHLALCHHKGVGIEVNYAKAARLFERAARAGVTDAAYALGLCHRFGWGVPRDRRMAFLWFAEAAKGGHVQSSYEMGMCYLAGRATVQSDTRAVEAFRRAVASYECWDTSVRSGMDEVLPEGGLSAKCAAGKALYMLGYCTLYRRGITVDLPEEQAMERFAQAASLEDHTAMLALGDMLSRRAADEEDTQRAVAFYKLAAEGDEAEALLLLAERSRALAAERRQAGDTLGVEEAYAESWKTLARCAKQGSTEALLALAESAYFGWGTEKNAETAYWFLRRAEAREAYGVDGEPLPSYGMEQSACLWLGDFHYAGWAGTVDLMAADAAYRYAAAIPVDEVEAACPFQVLKERWHTRVDYLRRIRAEAYYRLAILRAVGFEDDRRAQREEAFAFLCAAISAGHPGALDDFARMYHHEMQRISASAGDTVFRFSSKKKKEERKGDTAYDYLAWMTAYYAALRPTLRVFDFDPVPMPHALAPAYVTAPVTPAMRAAALNHVGECYFEGRGVTEDRGVAVACYRQAADMAPVRGEAAVSIAWANYSLGWCLLHGEGVSKDPREGVRRMTRAATHHAEAAYTMGHCYERGIGVDAESIREAVKYYRKAKALGHRHAALRLKVLEARLR